MSKERRVATRHNVQLPAEIDLGGGEVANAMTRDGSMGGMLLMAQGKLEPGQLVTIRCFMGESKETVIVRGLVVREERLGPEEFGLWHSRVAVRMDEPNPELADRFEAEAAREAGARK